MSGMDYHPDAAFLGYKTAGMFLVGIPFLLVFAIIFAAIGSLIHRRSPLASWLLTGMFGS
jgi:hypothetical protein